MLRFFKRIGIREKIIAGYTSIFILTSSLGGMFIYLNVKKNISNNIQSELKNSTESVLNMVRTAANVSVKNYLRAICEKDIENIRGIYNRFSSGRINEKEAKEEVRRILFSQVIGKTGYVYSVNSQGVPVIHPNPDVVGKNNWSNEPFVKKMIKIKHGYMEYDWRSPGEPYFRKKAVYMGYFEPWDWILAVSTYADELKDLINVDDFRQSVLALKFGKTGYSFIIDGDGNPIIHPILDGQLSEEILSSDKDNIISALIRQKKGKIEYSWKNSPVEGYRKKFVIFNYIREYDWIVASSGYVDEIYAILHTVEKTVLFSIVVMVGFGFMSTFWLSRQIIEPLKSLTKTLGTKVPDNLAIRIPVISDDEIGKLIVYFNSFMEQLEIYSDNLKKEVFEHRFTSEALAKSEWRYRNILKCIHEGYFEADLDGNILFFNSSMEKISGYPNEDLMGKSIFDIINDKHIPLLSKIFDGRGIKNHDGRIYEWELIRKDGTVSFVEISLSVMVDNVNRQNDILCVVRDVTMRVQTQHALKQSEEMFSKAFKCSPSGMFLASDESVRLINVNESFLRFTGYELNQVLKKTLVELNYFNNIKEGRRLLRLLKEKKSLRNQEIEFCRASGEIRHGMLSAEILEIAGKSCILAAFEDYTEVKNLEREVLEMNEKERRKIAFALHDDLCPQLIGIDVLFEILKQKLQKNLPSEVDYADKIGVQLQKSIQKTRLLSRGLCPVDIAQHGFNISLSELVRYAEDMFGIPCQLDCDEFSPFTDNTSATHAYYIAHEAIHNAIKHATAKKIFVHFTARNNQSILMVKDDGKGISQADQHKGMGLKIMQYRARRINGSLEIRKSSRGGTIVLLEIEHDKDWCINEKKANDC